MILGTGHAVVQRHENIGRLDVAVDDALLMGVLDRVADGDEQFQTLAGGQVVVVAVLREGDAIDQLHHEVRPARLRGARIVDFGDVGVIHDRQGLLLGCKARDHLAGIHARLDDLQGHLAPDRLLLEGHVDDAHAAFADFLVELVRADLGAGALGDGGEVDGGADARGGRLEKVGILSACARSRACTRSRRSGRRRPLAAGTLPAIRGTQSQTRPGRSASSLSSFAHRIVLPHTGSSRPLLVKCEIGRQTYRWKIQKIGRMPQD